jgi:NAD-dependent deacetylase
MNPSNAEHLAQAREWVQSAQRVVVLTGAGISAESGVPTFRGPEGLWRNFSPEELANPHAFRRDPKLVWEWYEWRRGLVVQTEPNAGHRALVQMERQARAFTLVTQNVDGLHDRAGSGQVLKLHGDLWRMRCTGCGTGLENRVVPLPELPPRCHCGALLRPDIVWFGECLPQDVLRSAWVAAEAADLFLVIGTSALVQPAASLPLLAKSRGARLVEISLEETALTLQVDMGLYGPSAEILPLLLG